MLEILPGDNTPTLTPREQEVFDRLLGGSTPKEIAYQLKITYDTVITHQKNIYRKLGVHNITELLIQYRPVTRDTTTPSAENKRKKLLPAPHEMKGIFLTWYPIGDKYSTYIVTVTEECIIMSGTMSDYISAYSGAHGIIEETTLGALKTMKSFSFKVIGDGNEYSVRFVTAETIDGDHWMYTFPTVKDEILTITVNIPDDLFRRGWSDKDVGFNQNNIIYIQIQPVNQGRYDLKFWDIRLHR